MEKIGAANGNSEQKINWLEEEFNLLKLAVDSSQKENICHQIYDMLYLLFEIAADNDCDLDRQWGEGARKKEKKYLGK